jgi:hypothetical protein
VFVVAAPPGRYRLKGYGRTLDSPCGGRDHRSNFPTEILVEPHRVTLVGELTRVCGADAGYVNFDTSLSAKKEAVTLLQWEDDLAKGGSPLWHTWRVAASDAWNRERTVAPTP